MSKQNGNYIIPIPIKKHKSYKHRVREKGVNMPAGELIAAALQPCQFHYPEQRLCKLRFQCSINAVSVSERGATKKT